MAGDIFAQFARMADNRELKQQYIPYLADYAPEISSQRQKISVSTLGLEGKKVTIKDRSGRKNVRRKALYYLSG